MRNNSLLLRRMVMLLIGTIFIGSAIVGVIYSQRSKSMFAEMKAQELEGIVVQIFNTFEAWLANRKTKNELETQLANAAMLSDAQVFIVDVQQPQLYIRFLDYGKNAPASPEDEERIWSLLYKNATSIKEKKTDSLVGVQTLPGTNEDYLVVAQPVWMQDTDNIVYIIFLTKSVNSVTGSLSGMNQTLLITFLIVFLVIMVPLYWASRRMMAPLSTMRDIALSMAQGDFDLRANEQEPGEIGQLSKTLNYLAGTLSHTISELKVERNRLRRIIDGLAEGIIALDADLNITHVNPSVCELLGIEETSDAGGLSNDIIPKDLLDDFQRVMEESATVVRSYHWKNMVLRVSITPLTNDYGYTVGAVGLFHDITESERLEQTRREFVANVSHELRTPLSALRGLAEVLNDDMLKDEDDKHRYYGYILRESLRMNRLVDDLLELSRLQTGSVSTRKQRFNIREAVMEIHEKYAVNADDMDIAFEMDIQSPVPGECPDAYGNPDRFEQISVILIDNALKYTDEGGRITLGLTWNDDEFLVSVQDTGVGIPEDDKEKVFDRFYKVDKAHTGDGTGLGLSIARELQTLLGERIWVSETSSKGTTFIYTVARADKEQAAPEGELPPASDNSTTAAQS